MELTPGMQKARTQYLKTMDKKPEWFKIQLPTQEVYQKVKQIVNSKSIATVCEEARCPNIGECWSGGTATFMIMGDTCTRGCRFCHIKTALTPNPLNPYEPQELAQSIKQMNIDYAVITSVDRDDLPDQGSSHFARSVKEIRKANPGIKIEILTPDFQGQVELIDKIIQAKPDVFAHNIETVKRLQSKVRDRRANYEQSLKVLKYVKEKDPKMYTKSSIMVGVGETKEEVIEAMKDLRKIGVDMLTIGQYLRPAQRLMPVHEYIHPTTFEFYKKEGEKLGFTYVLSGPLIRSSYKAGDFFKQHVK